MRNILIVGASSGIGLALSEILRANGDRVFGTYLKNETTGSVAYDSTLHDSQIDLPEVLDGLVYCPGSIHLKPFDRVKPEDFLQDYELQVLGAIKILQKALPHLRKSEAASVVLFSTVAVQTGLPYHSIVASSKGAIEGLVKSLAAEFAPKIRCNGIAPSLTDTPLAAGLLNTEQKREANAARHPLRRIGTADDIAQLAAFLLSENSGWITGQIIHADGGMSTLKV